MRRSFTQLGTTYATVTIAAVLSYLLIRWIGVSVFDIAPAADGPATAAASGDSHSAGHSSLLAITMIALATITLASRALGWLCDRYLRQPPVIGEILAGILLGPSLLGMVLPGAMQLIFPPEVMPSLGIISKIGIVLFMFVVGLELDAPALRSTSKATVMISHASIVAPFVLGSLLALYLFPRYGRGEIGFTAFSLFLGISMSVTAFPVLARILQEFRINSTPFGGTAMACAAIDDVTAWTLLALVIGIVTAKVDNMMITLPLLVGYFAVMFLAVRPIYQWLARRIEASDRPVSTGSITAVLIGLLLSAAATDLIGIHALFGAFLLGVFLPHTGKLAEGLRERMEDLVKILFLPAFFAVTGLRTEIGLVAGGEDWFNCALICVVACLGKFGGTYIAARYSGLPRAESSALGVMMNTRGLMELIVLNIGLDLGIISPQLFAMMVIMALVTTFLTSPLLKWLLPHLNLNSALHRRSATTVAAAAPPPASTSTPQ